MLFQFLNIFQGFLSGSDAQDATTVDACFLAKSMSAEEVPIHDPLNRHRGDCEGHMLAALYYYLAKSCHAPSITQN